jgi:hypothetical protein
MSSFAGLVHAHAVRDDLGDGARGRGNALFIGHEHDVVVADVDATCSSVAAPRIAISGRLSAASESRSVTAVVLERASNNEARSPSRQARPKSGPLWALRGEVVVVLGLVDEPVEKGEPGPAVRRWSVGGSSASYSVITDWANTSTWWP